MAFRIALCGTVTQRTGTEEAYWLIVFDSEMNGMNMEAKVKETEGGAAIMWRDGMNTYTGSLASLWKGHSPCRGLFYHDSDGGPQMNVPRGTFNLTATRIESGDKYIVFDGSYSDDTVSGSHFATTVVFDANKNPTSCPGSWDEPTNTLTIHHGSNRLLIGKWSTSSSQVEKYCGVFYNKKDDKFDTKGCPDGTFLLYPSELSDD
eukprot:TRINITY_DN1515_c1_g1_i1.p1 TRINITY_DN1515_c1_g1~~TRINITY_DN1515_c1_g1_i1.p1  ORF type:complete len:205 (+),score=41.29 TRINITY_DN1515_c1_g1_i1:110-724(+)